MPRAFVIRPFNEKKDSSGKKIDFNKVHDDLIGPALDSTDYTGSTTGELVDSGNIREDMFALIFTADLVICDITVHNANVFYELGIRHSLRKKHTILIKGTPTNDGTPFDLSTDRYLAYDIDNPAASKDALIKTINATINSVVRDTDSPVFQLLPDLLEADPDTVIVVPFDFQEEVKRAAATQAKGWLRLLADEVCGKRFQWPGLKLIAKTQWELKDYRGARQSWEIIRKSYADDPDANLALANIYERLFREDLNPINLENSDQAIARVLANELTTRTIKAEALALRGRNQKTRWRLELEPKAPMDERRKSAINRCLIRSYEDYRDAYFEDLNCFYPGLSALQSGVILLSLSEQEVWYDCFDNDKQADNFLNDLKETVANFNALVPTSIKTALSRMNEDDDERVWANISHADVQFLINNKRESRVVQAYVDAIPVAKPFYWDASCGQLELFRDLGIHTQLAEKIIAEINSRLEKPTTIQRKQKHLVLFVGHRMDLPDRPAPRFPASQESHAKMLIQDKFKQLLDSHENTLMLASAAPGADILAHEICDELNIKSVICLPMPATDFASNEFKDLDLWRTRFLNFKGHHDIWELSNSPDLPKWLLDSGKGLWERGNQWVLNMALTWGAERITLVALWDGKEQGDAPGGTAQMIRLAENSGDIHIVRIDSSQLLK